MDERDAAFLIPALLLPDELRRILDKHGVSVRISLSDAAGQPLAAAAEGALLLDLQEGQSKLEHLRRLAAVGTLGAGVTHEARNLLTGSLGFAQLLKTKAQEALDIPDTARLIETELRRCVDILSSFLKLSRSGQEAMAEVNVADVVAAVERLVAATVRQRGCTLRSLIVGELPKVSGRATELQRVLINLILNAADAAQRPGVHILVSARTAAHGGVAISVADDGPGVPAALMEHIFEPFFSTKQGGEGTGLGLALSRSIVEAHGGRLTLEPAAEGSSGATFTLTLPAAVMSDGRASLKPGKLP